MNRIPMLIADDHFQVRAQILTRLNREAAFEIVGVADNSSTAVSCALAARPCLVLIDPMMSDGMGLDAIRHIRAELPATAVVVLTAFTDTAQKIELQKLGVRHILNKGIESHQLIQLLQEAGRAAAPNGA